MEQLLGTTGGVNKKSPQAKVATAKREQKIVELRLRNVSFPDIARALGISEPGAVRAFYRTEGAKLDLAEARLHKALDANTDNWKPSTADYESREKVPRLGPIIEDKRVFAVNLRR